MITLKSSKFVVCSVLCGCLLVGCNESSATQLSLMNLEGNSLYTNPINNASLWRTMSQSFALKRDAFKRPEVQKQIAIYQKNSEELYKVLQDAEHYISYVYHETQKRNMPAELALLPVVESDFKPHAKSRVGAIGIWQFMPATGKGLGLTRSNSYDGLKDVVASTDAALTYLSGLRQSFKNDWFIALGAYNWGSGNIEKAIKKGRHDYWSLKMPKETRDYVPKLLALAAIIQNPERYNIKLPNFTTELSVASIQANDKVDLKKVAESSGIDLDTMKALNPGYHKLETVKNAPNTLLVPADKEQQAILAMGGLVKIPTPAASTKSAKTQDTNKSLLQAILDEGKWVIVALADIPASQENAKS